MKEEIDYRIGQKVLGTFILEDKGQDFIELDVLENGIILGNCIIFKNGRLSVLGIGKLDGSKYYNWEELRMSSIMQSFNGLYIYIKETSSKKIPLPWNARTLNYKIIGMKKVIKPNRFLSPSRQNNVKEKI